ncbi:PAS domain S-box protein [Nostoc sp. PA-18-2419]|uniref:PAS domain S-box protein n=1 Tax=Nostoc sp. PA-18-2419 TaxID=2575443 RepID=UPI001108C0C4|nr:PAS domain S-box protein [Nostoc sp. PA-18-2419]
MGFNDQLINLPTLYHVINRTPFTITSDSYVVEAIALMTQERCNNYAPTNSDISLDLTLGGQSSTDYILVMEGGYLLGIFTEQDIVRLVASRVDLSTLRMTQVMRRPVVTLRESDCQDIFIALSLLRQHQIRHLPILDDSRQVVGVITEASLLQAFDLVKIVGVVEGLQQSLQKPTDKFTQIARQIEIDQGRCQTQNYLRLWFDAQSTEIMEVNHELEQALEEFRTAQEELRQQNQELLAARELVELERQRYQDLFEFAPDGYLVTDAAGIIQEVNHAAAMLLAMPQEFLINKRLIVFIAQEDRQTFTRRLNNLQQVQEWETYLKPRKNKPFPASIKMAAMYDSQGEQVGWRWLICNISERQQAKEALRQANDELERRVAQRTTELVLANTLLQQEISQRQRAEEALRQSENLYRQLVESQTDIIIRIDLQGQITFANLAACETFGWSQDEFRGQSSFEFLHPDDLPQVMENMTNLISLSCSLTTGERRALTVNGIRWFQWKSIPIKDEKGEIIEIQGVGRDITEQQAAQRDRQLAEEALCQSEDKFRNFAENTEAAIWIASPEAFQPLYISPAYEKIWGRACKNLLEQPDSWLYTVHLDDRHRHTKLIEQLLNNQSASAEYRISRLDGSLRWIWNRGFSVCDAQGKINYYGGIAEDITDRKLAEESLRESEARLNLALETACMGIWDRNLITNIGIWSANMGLLYGLSKGSPCPPFEEYLNLIHSEDREFLVVSIISILEEGRGTVEYRVIWPDGSIHWLNCTCQVYYNELGKPIRMLGTNRDITDRKLNEQKISEQAALLDIATDAILVRDFQFQILFWNKGAERIYGWLDTEVLAKDSREILFPVGTQPQLEAPLKSVIETGSWQGELDKVTKSGKKIVVESRWTLMHDADGEPKSILCVDTDITEKKQLQEQFFRTQRLESIGTLAGGIAHDLNNILTPILAAAQLLQDKFFQDEEHSQQLMALVESNAKRGATLVKQVLSFARGFKQEHTIIHVGYLISEIIQIAKQTFPKSIEFSTVISEDILAMTANTTQVHQVLINLIVNARDALPDGGNIQISATNQFIDEAYTKMNLDAKVGNYIVITVADNGIGIPSEILDKIFEPFFTTKEINRGTGLGLSTALGIIKSHGGFIKVSSQILKGSAFQVFLPAMEVTQVLNIEDSQAYPGQGELVLVVDDEAEIRDIAKIVLENHNYQMLAASNGIEAIALYAQHKHRIQAVLMDIMMPEMDGITAIRTLQKMNNQVKIIACTGLNSIEIFTQAAEANVQTVLSKPYTARELLKSLHQLLK